MKKIASFFFCWCFLFSVFYSCSTKTDSPVKKRQRKFRSTPVPVPVLEINTTDSLDLTPVTPDSDSLPLDSQEPTFVIIHDSSESRLSIPSKHTFKHFYNYLHINNRKGPIS